MKIFKLIVICIAIMLFFDGCKKNSTDSNNSQTKTITERLTQNGEIAGWTFSGSGWTAYNITDLTTYIDGAAPLYQRHGFIEAAYQKYQGSINGANATIDITIYNQGTSANTLALYNDTDTGFNGAIDWTSTGHAGDAAHYIRSGNLSQKLAFYRNGYYVYVDIDLNTNESLNIIQQFALNIDGKILH
jgi:hypothetical protein